MQTVERRGSFFRFRVRPFDPVDADAKPSDLLLERELVFGADGAAAAFLRNFADDPFALRGFQSVLAQLGDSGSVQEMRDQWIDRLARHLSSGRVTVVEQTPRSPGGKSTEGSQTASAPIPPPVPRRLEQAVPVVVPDPPTFSPATVDEEAQVQTLIKAAEDGTPFCEECAKAAAAARSHA